MNALAPFYVSWSLEANRRTTAGGIVALWELCLAYSTTSALGFAAQNREEVNASRQLNQDAYDDIRRELKNLETRHKRAISKDRVRLEKRIDDARVRLAAVRNNNPAPADAQSLFLSSLTFGWLDARHVRMALVALFAFMVEMCATLGLFAALSHSRSVAPQPRSPEQSLPAHGKKAW
jgi:septal ring factor EnvC (AmiA/AmiB activator)